MLNVITGLLDAPTPPVTSSYESIATTVVGSGGSSTITFSSIPSTYKHLQLRILSFGANGWVDVKANSTSSASGHHIQGNGTAAAAYANVGNAYSSSIYLQPTTYGVASITDILDYADTNKNKTFRTLSGSDANGSGTVYLFSNLYNSTSAISSLTVTNQAGNFTQYSSFALYGIKG